MSSASLPPVGNLPHWSRVTSLDRAHYPRPADGERPVHRLNVQPAPAEGITLAVGSGGWDGKGSGDVRSESGAGSARSERGLEHGKATATGGVEASSLAGRRILQLERSLEFVQKEHADMLQRLHAEVDRLTRENKDLQFMLIVNQRDLHSSEERSSIDASESNESKLSRSESCEQFSGVNSKGSGTERTNQIRSEKEVAQAIKNDHQVTGSEDSSAHPVNVTGGALKRRPLHQAAMMDRAWADTAQQTSSPMLLVQAGKGGLAPVKTSFGLAGPASILEFQQLVRRLQKVNQQQADESPRPTSAACDCLLFLLLLKLLQLKTKLRNAAIADRLPANSVLVAKPLFSSRSNEQWQTTNRLPKIPIKNPVKKMPLRTEPKLSLPSLVQPLRREVAQDGSEKDSQKMLPS
ncbi:coiled-coil domain-containing protein 74B [Lethenteron reissneri]|uniref:coiled-coil domain-containing protein 74B n=1 Tax=Lethenteron reissneri TaxID=7753 RepID=UPI002AB7B6A5|nr:coiled-coil domain-containing protein 74B [Lethenteron reissneri]